MPISTYLNSKVNSKIQFRCHDHQKPNFIVISLLFDSPSRHNTYSNKAVLTPQVMNGTAEFGIGIQLMHYEKSKHVQWSQMLFANCDVLATRQPVKVSELGNLIQPFPPLVWAVLLLTVSAVAVVFYIIYKVGHDNRDGPAVSGIYFLFFTVASLTESVDLSLFRGSTYGNQTPLNIRQTIRLCFRLCSFQISWEYLCLLNMLTFSKSKGKGTTNFILEGMFKTCSALNWGTITLSSFQGRGLTLVWIVASFFITLFYACNLRAFLISPAFESPVDYPEDVIKRGATMYIPSAYRLSRFVGLLVCLYREGRPMQTISRISQLLSPRVCRKGSFYLRGYPHQQFSFWIYPSNFP